jgi:hypothetical protein
MTGGILTELPGNDTMNKTNLAGSKVAGSRLLLCYPAT